MDRVRICHCTTVHGRTDTRVAVKECASLARRYGGTVLLVADGKGVSVDHISKLRTEDIGRAKLGGRIGRMIFCPIQMMLKVTRLRPDVVHFHDPELMPMGILLKALGYKVVYDVHEDVPRQILSKHWIPLALRKPISLAVSGLERMASFFCDAIVVATVSIGERFNSSKTLLVRNFPLQSEFSYAEPQPYDQRSLTICYVGAISETRGAREMVNSIPYLKDFEGFRLDLAGPFNQPGLRRDLELLPGWDKVRTYGLVSRSDVTRIIGASRAGLVILNPTPAYIDSLPVKMFEYMAAGVPVIASDFPLWREIIERCRCGLLVDPTKPEQIAKAIIAILEDPTEAKAMGARGRRCVEETFNWAAEEKKLYDLYDKLLE